MSGRNAQRKLGTTRGSPRRSRTAKASRISRYAAMKKAGLAVELLETRHVRGDTGEASSRAATCGAAVPDFAARRRGGFETRPCKRRRAAHAG